MLTALWRASLAPFHQTSRKLRLRRFAVASRRLKLAKWPSFPVRKRSRRFAGFWFPHTRQANGYELQFPFVIYYRWEPQHERITIYAIMHSSREPNYWHHRI